MSALICHQFPYNDDNYGVLLHDKATGYTAAIDAGCAASYQASLDETGYQLSHIFVTHHHGDHTAGLSALKQATSALVLGPHNTKQEVRQHIDIALKDGDEFNFAGHHISAVATPGHTLDMINYALIEARLLFSGDSLFVLGCGRLFEGDGPMMWRSLTKLMALPSDMLVYSAHEYALANARFAETIEPDNQALIRRIAALQEARDKGLASTPSLLSEELATNPFLRADKPHIAAYLGMADASAEDVFTEIRRRKDQF